MEKLIKLILQRILYFLGYIIKIFFSLLKIDNNKIFMFAFNGNKYACNQKYLTEYMLNNNSDFKIVWVYKRNETYLEIPNDCIKVKKYSFSYFYHFYTSRFITTNMRILCYDLLKKRENQFYIQTWHSSARQKKIEKDAGKQLSLLYRTDAQRDSKMIDLMISGSEFSTSIYKNSFWYSGKILNIGTMRNDMLFNISKNDVMSIKRKYNIDDDAHLLLYAPTFRNIPNYDYSFNYKEIKKVLEEKFGGKWVIAIKQHPNCRRMLEENSDVIDLTTAQDIQELFVITDVLITDYSSVIFDYMLLKRPFFLYVPDFNTYDRDLYFNFSDLPTTLSYTMDELKKNICEFNESAFLKNLNEFDSNFLKSYEKGSACKEMYNYINEKRKEYEEI